MDTPGKTMVRGGETSQVKGKLWFTGGSEICKKC